MNTLAFVSQFGGWWNELTLAKQLFYGIGLVAGLTSLVLAVLAFIGIEHVDGADGIDGLGSAPGGGVFSVKPLTGFFLGFGWAGGLALDGGLPLGAALAIAFGAGGGIMAVIIAMIRAIYSLKSDGTVKIQSALGAVGTVYVTIPPGKAQGGQVVVSFSGRQETLAALSEGGRALASGEKVKVVRVVDGRTVLVESL